MNLFRFVSLSKFDKILNWLMAMSIFLDAYIIARGSLPFDFYHYYLIYFVFIINYMAKKKPVKLFERWFLISILMLFVASIIASLQQNILGFGFVKQVIGITFSSAAYYAFIRFNDFNLQKVFDLYLRVAFWVASIGIFEEFAKIAGLGALFKHAKTVKLGFHRVWSIMGEPYFLAVVLIPALFYYGAKMFGNRGYNDRSVLVKFGVILTGTLFTFSSAGFMAIGFMAIVIAWEKGLFSFKKGRILLLPFVLIAVFSAYQYVQKNMYEFRTKINQTIEAFNNTKITPFILDQMNSTTFALYSNFKIAQESYNKNKLLGGGLGSHAKNYDKLFTSQFDAKYLERFGELNKYDANSLFIRLLSETGLLGLAMFFFFMLKFRLKRKHLEVPELANFVLINHGIFILFIVRLVRTGNYIGNGFFFFFFLYYFTAAQVKKYYKKQKLELAQGQ
ncbi:hypothetical protein OAB01_03970 [Bacteroidia bacterium]|nr:hypothetical protein [Bacteroidia bacterium]